MTFRSTRILKVTVLGLLLAFSTSTTAISQQILAAIVTADLPRYHQAHEAFTSVLKVGGFDEEKLKVFTQTPNPDKMSLANSLRRMEAAGASLVVTYGSQATAVAKEELKKTPLLFCDVYDPVALGTVKSLSAPGTDASGATSKTDLALLVENLMAIKAVQKVGVLYTKGERGSEQQLEELKEQGKAFGFSVIAENARNPNEAVELAKKLATSTDALYLSESVSVSQKAKDILAAARGNKCIAFSQNPGSVEAGALIGLEADPEEQGKLVAVHALQVLQGQKVHILPVREAKKIELKVNQETASALGLTIPPNVASKAKVM